MSEPFIAEIRAFPYNFPPRGWADCNGQVLPIAQNTALFALIGTTYGGDGRTTLALPDLQDRVPIGAGNGPGLTNRRLGQEGGSDTVVLTETRMAGHTHQPSGDGGVGTSNDPAGTVPARPFGGGSVYGPAGTDPVDMAAEAITSTGGAQPHENRMPTQVVRYCIALQGIFPSRS